MKNWEIIKQALNMVGMTEPNTLFIAADSTLEYLHFAEIDYSEVEPIEKDLNSIGVFYMAKYETLVIEREKLWDNEKGN